MGIWKNKFLKPVTTVSIVTALCLLGDSMLYIVLPIYYKEVGLNSLWEVGLILSINRLVRIPLNPFIGWVYHHLSLKTGILISVILAVITTIGYGVAQGFFIWIILRLLWGVAWSFLRLGGVFTVVQNSSENNRGEKMGFYNGIYRLGSLFGMAAGGVLVSIFGISIVSISFGVIMIVGIPLILYTMSGDTISESQNKASTNIRAIISNKLIIKVISSGFLLSLVIQGIFVSTLSLLLSFHFSEQISILTITFGVTALAGIIQGIRWAWEPFLAVKFGMLSDRAQSRYPLFIGFLLLSGICLLIIPISMSIYLWLIIVLLFMVTATALTTFVDTIIADLTTNSNSKTVMTYHVVFLDLGATLGPLIAYLIISIENGVVYTYALAGIILLTLALLWLREAFMEKVRTTV
ncbi:MAG: MFS transporter [Bacillus sp. (in: Bacteria)]|nr:MFS transporter [Bacillus sp. (in: firmicutes)]